MGLRFVIDSRLPEVAREFGRRIPQEIALGYLASAEVAASEIRRQISSWPAAESGLSTKTGRLARSFVPIPLREATSDGLRITGGVKSDLPYARIQDQGGTIRPHTAQYLAIPLTPAARRTSPRMMLDLVCIRKKGRDPILARIVGKGKRQRILPMYALKGQVTLKGHKYIAAAEVIAAPKIQQIMLSALRRLSATMGR